MTWLALLFALEVGYIPDAYIGPVDAVENWSAGLTDLDAELLFFDHFYIGGGVRTYIAEDGGDFTVWPFLSDYRFRAGLRFGGVDVFWRHYCWHPTAPYGMVVLSEDGSHDEIGIRFEGRFRLLP